MRKKLAFAVVMAFVMSLSFITPVAANPSNNVLTNEDFILALDRAEENFLKEFEQIRATLTCVDEALEVARRLADIHFTPVYEMRASIHEASTRSVTEFRMVNFDTTNTSPNNPFMSNTYWYSRWGSNGSILWQGTLNVWRRTSTLLLSGHNQWFHYVGYEGFVHVGHAVR